MDLADMAQDFEMPMVRAIPQDRCKMCLIPMASHLLEGGLCIDCDMKEATQ
jgi:hypothetical protein